MIGEGVSTAITGAGQANRDVVAGAWDGGRECCIAGDACAEAGWLSGGDVVACVATALGVEPGAGADTDTGVSSPSGPWVDPRRRF